jgi:hypothetical protein
MADDVITMTSLAALPTPSAIARTDLPAAEKSALRRFVEQVRSGGSIVATRAGATMHATGSAIRQGGEALLTGGVLGAIHGHTGTLDHGRHKVPVDGAVAGAGLLGSVALAMVGLDEFSPDARNVGSAAAAVWSARMTKHFTELKKAGLPLSLPGSGPTPPPPPGAAAHGDFGADGSLDPIVARIRNL